MSQLSLANEDILGSLVKNTQNDAKKFFKTQAKNKPNSFKPAPLQSIKILYKTNKKRLLTVLGTVIFTNGNGPLNEEIPLFYRSPKTHLVPWIGVDRNKLDIGDNIMIDINAESTYLPVFCKILIIHHGAVRINSPPIIERDVSVQVGEPNEWLLSAKNQFFSSNKPDNNAFSSYVPFLKRERTMSSTVSNEYYSAPHHKYRGKQTDTYQKSIQVQEDMFYATTYSSTHNVSNLKLGPAQTNATISTEDLISYLKLNIFSKEDIMSPYTLENENRSYPEKIIDNKLAEKRTRKMFNHKCNQKINLNHATRYEEQCPITGARRLRLLMPFVDAISNLGESDDTKTAYNYVEENETIERTEEYHVSDASVDTNDFIQYLNMENFSHLQLLSETASISNRINIEEVQHLSTSTESIYDNLKSISTYDNDLPALKVTTSNKTEEKVIEIKDISLKPGDERLSRSIKINNNSKQPNRSLFFDRSPLSPVDRPPRSPRSPLTRSPHGRSPLARSPIASSPVSSTRSPIIQSPIYARQIPTRSVETSTCTSTLITTTTNTVGTPSIKLYEPKLRSEKRNSSIGTNTEKKRLSWADETIFNNDDNSPRPPLCQTFELTEQIQTFENHKKSEDKSTTTTDLIEEKTVPLTNFNNITYSSNSNSNASNTKLNNVKSTTEKQPILRSSSFNNDLNRVPRSNTPKPSSITSNPSHSHSQSISNQVSANNAGENNNRKKESIDDYDISDILARYNIKKQCLEKPRKIKLRKDSETNIKSIIDSIETKLENISKCTAQTASYGKFDNLDINNNNYEIIHERPRSHTHSHHSSEGILDLSIIAPDITSLNSESSSLMMCRPHLPPPHPHPHPSPVECDMKRCNDYYANCARYPLISRAVGSKPLCLGCEMQARNRELPPPRLTARDRHCTNKNMADAKYINNNIRRRSGSEYSVPNLDLNNDPHARTLSANRAEEYSYYINESTPRLDDNQVQQQLQQSFEIPINKEKDPNETLQLDDPKSMSNNNSSKLKKSHSLKANNYFSKFDEAIKNTCDLVQPYDNIEQNVYSFSNDFEDLNVYEVIQKRYLRSNYDKSLGMYSDKLSKNDPNDENCIIENMLKIINPQIPNNSTNDSNSGKNTANPDNNNNIENECQTNNNSKESARACEKPDVVVGAVNDDPNDSSFFEVSKKVESQSNITIDSTLEVDLDYLNESFII